jgi:hypothetical protein
VIFASMAMPNLGAASLAAAGLLADGYRLFLDPLPLWQDSRWPWLALPLCYGVALVYKSIRCKTMRDAVREAASITFMIILGMSAAAVVLALIVRGLEH